MLIWGISRTICSGEIRNEKTSNEKKTKEKLTNRQLRASRDVCSIGGLIWVHLFQAQIGKGRKDQHDERFIRARPAAPRAMK